MISRVLAGILTYMTVQTSAQVSSVTGSVFDAETLTPIMHAQIRYRSGSYLQSTDSTGRFEIEDCFVDTMLLFQHPFYQPHAMKADDSKPMRVLLEPCCKDAVEAQQMFTEYCRKNLRYPASLRRKEIGGEVLIRFSLDSALTVTNVTTVKDIEGQYAKFAHEFMLTLPLPVRRMLSYFNSTEFLLPLVLSYNKADQTYTAPVSNDATVLEPVKLVAFGIRRIE